VLVLCCLFQCQLYSFYTVHFVIDCVAGEIICLVTLVASVYVSVRLSVGTFLFEPFDLCP